MAEEARAGPLFLATVKPMLNMMCILSTQGICRPRKCRACVRGRLPCANATAALQAKEHPAGEERYYARCEASHDYLQALPPLLPLAASPPLPPSPIPPPPSPVVSPIPFVQAPGPPGCRTVLQVLQANPDLSDWLANLQVVLRQPAALSTWLKPWAS